MKKKKEKECIQMSSMMKCKATNSEIDSHQNGVLGLLLTGMVITGAHKELLLHHLTQILISKVHTITMETEHTGDGVMQMDIGELPVTIHGPGHGLYLDKKTIPTQPLQLIQV